MTPEERIFAGVLFCPGEPELVAKKLKTHNLNTVYNMTMEDEYEKRDQILHEILGEMGEGVRMQGPIYFHYGCHTKVGNRVFANFNLTVQDDAEVTIGDDVNFGPGCSIVTPVHPMVASERNEMLDQNGRSSGSATRNPSTSETAVGSVRTSPSARGSQSGTAASSAPGRW